MFRCSDMDDGDDDNIILISSPTSSTRPPPPPSQSPPPLIPLRDLNGARLWTPYASSPSSTLMAPLTYSSEMDYDDDDDDTPPPSPSLQPP
ncbi:delphilin [Anoplophora glabripennis]|uniref:delphilin n=1 Tax=Anoplophora glabripennis TaxID=217634 RepID=UPI000C75C3C2|nr:delphilin [Anoplophora glabripennis]